MKIKSSFLAIIVLMIVSFSYFFSVEKQHQQTDHKTIPIVNLYDIPLYFEQNQGQTVSEVKYLTKCPGHHFYFAPSEVTMVMQGKEKGAALKIQFIGSNSQLIKGIEEQKYKTSYFIGPPDNWKTAIPNFAKVLYQDLYPGIDAIFYGNGKELEYDFCISPNVNPSKILLRFNGAQKLAINQEGALDIFMDDDIVAQMKKPFIYQMNEGKKEEIEGQFVLAANDTIRFSLKDYDATKQLIIDPVLNYSTYLGGSTGVQAKVFGITVDNDGNAYVTGSTSFLNFPTTTGAFQSTLNGSSNVFVTKFNSDGTALIYSTYLGGSNNDEGHGIAIDSNGDAYIAGYTPSSNFPTTSGAFQTARHGNTDAFVTKFNSDGTALIYSTYLGGSGTGFVSNYGRGIAIDDDGNAYVTGDTNSTNFPTTSGAFQTAYNGTVGGFSRSPNAFITKLNSDGTALIYSTYLGGAGAFSFGDQGNSIAVDENGNSYITGSTLSSNFPTTTGAFQTIYNGLFSNVFVTKLNSGGTGLSYSTYLGGSNNNIGNGIAIDSSGNAYIAGYTYSTNFPTTVGAFQTTNHTVSSDSNAFITKLNPGGTGLSYSTYLGGETHEEGNGIAVISGEAYVTGNTSSSDFPTTEEAFQTTSNGAQNTFLTKFNSAGTELIYSTYLGGSQQDESTCVAVDNSGNAYIAGTTRSLDFPTTVGAFQTEAPGQRNAFIANFTFQKPTTTTTLSISPNPAFVGQTITFIASVSPSDATGEVTFFNKNSFLGTASLSGGLATLTVDNLPAGQYSITAIYGGNTSYSGSTSNIINLPVNLNPSLIQFTVYPNPAKEGKNVTLTATIFPSTATGSVLFFDGIQLLGVKEIVNGKATLKIKTLKPGIHFLIASYSGNNTYKGAFSRVITLKVKHSPPFSSESLSSESQKTGKRK